MSHRPITFIILPACGALALALTIALVLSSCNEDIDVSPHSESTGPRIYTVTRLLAVCRTLELQKNPDTIPDDYLWRTGLIDDPLTSPKVRQSLWLLGLIENKNEARPVRFELQEVIDSVILSLACIGATDRNNPVVRARAGRFRETLVSIEIQDGGIRGSTVVIYLETLIQQGAM